VDVSTDREAKQLLNLLNTHGLSQHMSVPTHNLGHTLDLVITRSGDTIVSNIAVTPLDIIADHYPIHFKLDLRKPGPYRKEVISRKTRAIDKNQFRRDILQSDLITNSAESLPELICQYDNCLSRILDDHAPLQKRVITVRPNSPWYTDELHQEKHKRRQLENRWKSNQLEVHRQAYTEQLRHYDKRLTTTRKEFYNDLVTKNASNPKGLYKVTNKLLNKQNDPVLPAHSSLQELTERFAKYFTDKISLIRAGLDSIRTEHASTYEESWPKPNCKSRLLEFRPVTEDDVHKLINRSATKSCDLDPIPTWLVKDCLDVLLPVITKIINLSLSTSTMPDSYKHAALLPLIKKALLDPEVLKNFRPVSNLVFVSKLIEKAVDVQMVDYMNDNNLYEVMQSAYKQFHSTETALLRIHSDIMCAVDNGNAVALVLLDLSAAFDTVDHAILLSRLSDYLGIQGKALAWFESYLSDRKQAVRINGVSSEYHDLKYGVPQGSVLGAKLFSVYTLPVGFIIRKYGLYFHIFADDKQLYVIFKPTPEASAITREQLENCISEVRIWFALNFLKCNDDKTIFMVISSRFKPSPPLNSIAIGEDEVNKSTSARNIGVLFDEGMSLESHVNKVTQDCYFQLYQLGSIRSDLTNAATKTLVHAYVTSRLDYCNSLFIELPKYLIKQLQGVQNAAARLISGTRKFDHITPVLIKLHWLPVHERIQFKVLLLTHKALNGKAPVYIRELLTLLDDLRPTRKLRSSNRMLLSSKKSEMKNYGDRAFSVVAPLLWNVLPNNIRTTDNLAYFKSNLKTLLFRKAYCD
jgi:hypothetical protein